MKKNYFLTLLLTFCFSIISFGQVLITELADPNNNASARYVEIYNAGTSAQDMTGWTLQRYTNGNSGLSSNVVDLAPIGSLAAGSFAIIAANSTVFETVYGMAADLNAGTGGPADSNGDDQIVLYNGSTVVDIFGVPGEDGTGTCHEFEDGRAERKATVTAANATWSSSEWNVWADSTVSGCTTHTNSPREAPSDFDPKAWIGTSVSSDPNLLISSPTEATVYTSTMVDVTIDIFNFNLSADNGSGVSDNSGDGYIKSTLVTVGGSTENADFFTTTLPQIEVVPGSSYTLTLELVDNSGSSLSPAVSKSVSFSSDFPCELALGEITTSCDTVTSASDTYSGTIAFTGGNTNATYTITAPSGVTVAGDNPDTVAEGIITFSGMTEGTNTEIMINGATNSSCALTRTLFSPVCTPLPISEDFSYADGSLTNNPLWDSFNGTAGDLMVTSGQVLVQHGTPSEDAQIEFASISGDIYYSFDFTVVDPGAPIPGNDNEYFAVFKDSGFGFTGRIDIVPPNDATSGDFSVGIATDGSTADAVWASDFVFDTTYRATVKYDQVANVAQLWIDASSESDPSISGADLDDANARTIVAFALRQSDSNSNEGILVDNLKIAATFADSTLSVSNLEIDGFAIYPNPVTNGRLSITSNSTDNKQVSIFNVLGKNVLNTTISGTKAEVNTSGISAGIYILKVVEGGKTATSKLIIR